MESALAWIGQIAAWIGQWIPRWAILDATEGAVKFTGFFLPRSLRVRFGGHDGEMRITACGPGIHWYWPAVTFWQTYPTARQTDNLPTQTFTTVDNKTIAVGGMLVYEVTDIVKLITTTHSAGKAVQDIALTAIHEVCCSMEWDKLREEQRKGTLGTKLKNACQKQLADYGCRVIKCMLTDLALTRVLKVIQSVNQDAPL